MDSHLTLLFVNIFVITVCFGWFYFYFMSMIRAIMDFNDEILLMVQKQRVDELPSLESNGKTLYDYFDEVKSEEE
jgi:hypothetical protein